MEQVMFPRPKKSKDKSGRRWRVKYNLAYDGGGGIWNGYYRTRRGAWIAAFWNTHIASWGGEAILVDQDLETKIAAVKSGAALSNRVRDASLGLGTCPTAGCDGDNRYAAPGRGHASWRRYPNKSLEG